ncbi:hypothetical protein [Jiangella aurantiaca]|uniref:hypothetical protein n=1 Tax=Jiangella aurantiaca TaxID=2530373 RepID=UPI0013A5E12A|nr:hypothetical protein [Jiangella aurantiaca]
MLAVAASTSTQPPAGAGQGVSSRTVRSGFSSPRPGGSGGPAGSVSVNSVPSNVPVTV